MSDEMVVVPTWSTGLEPTNIDQAFKLAQVVATTRMCGVKSPEDALIRIMAGRMLGFSAIQSIMEIRDIQGTPVVSAKALVAKALQSPACEYLTLVSSDDKAAVYKAKRKGSDEVVIGYSIDDAAKAGLTGKDNWKKMAPAMLRARASTAIARAVFPDALMGLYAAEEMGDGARIEAVVEAPPTPLPPVVAIPSVPSPLESSPDNALPGEMGETSEADRLAILEVDSLRQAKVGKTVEELRGIYSHARDKGLTGESLAKVTKACQVRTGELKKEAK